jgi:hypothetical protein
MRGWRAPEGNMHATRGASLHNLLFLELRAEELSLTNTPQFANPGTSWPSSTFGVITSTLNLGGQLAGSGGERWLWLAVKVMF